MDEVCLDELKENRSCPHKIQMALLADGECEVTDRDRLLSVFALQGGACIPVAPFIHVNFVRAFFGRQDVDPISDTIEVYRHFGFDIIHRNCTPAYDGIALDGERWKAETTVEKDDRGETTTTIVHTPRGDLRQVWRLNWVSEYDAEATPVEYLIKSESDLDLMVEYQPPVGDIDTSPIRRAREELGDGGIVAPWVQGGFNHAAYFVRPPDQLMLDALTHPEFYHALMSYFVERNKAIMSQFIAAGADVLSYAANIASGKMVSEAFFRTFVAPYEKDLIDFVQAHGAHVLYHNCGCAKNLLPCYAELGMRAYESLTPPPYGDTLLEHAFEAMGPDVVLSGNIDQIEFLQKATPQEIEARVASVLEQARRRGNFILATTDYFHEDTPHDNVHALADAARKA